jgi:hypothetical protein
MSLKTEHLKMIRPIATTNKMEHLCKLLRKADLRLQEIQGAEELSEVVHSVELALTRRSIDYFTDELDPAASVTAILLEAEELTAEQDAGLGHVLRWVRQMIESEHR